MNRTLVFRLLCAAIPAGLAIAGLAPALAADPIQIVAAENFYGELAAAIGGDSVNVTSILFSPDQDPHSFEVTASTAKLLTAAAIVIFNGADYDPWMPKLIAAVKSPKRRVIDVAKLVKKKPGDNPHLWYDPANMRVGARALADALIATNPLGEASYHARLGIFLASLDGLDERIRKLRSTHGGTEVTATEPVFGYMASALGLKMRNERFQLAVMNETEPSARDVAAFENDLRTGKAKILFYNSQTSNAVAEKLLVLAKQSGVPIVGVTETQPAGKTYVQWMDAELGAVVTALSEKTQ